MKQKKGMLRVDFITTCLEYLIDPGIALENEKVREAARKNNMKELKEVLSKEF